MANSKAKRPLIASARGALLLSVCALALWLSGELLLLSRSDVGQIFLARHVGLVSRPHVTQLLSAGMKRSLRNAGFSTDSLREVFPQSGAAPLRWELPLDPEGSLAQANYAISQSVRSRGADVISGREIRLPDGGSRLQLVVGLPRFATHEIVVTRPAPSAREGDAAPVALVLFGFDPDDPAAADALDATVPVSWAASVAAKSFGRLLERAHARKREILLSLPLEPINYPRVDPGPNTILVSMKAGDVRKQMRRQLAAASPAVAVSNNMGSLATQDYRTMRTVFDELRRQRLPFVHVEPTPGSLCRQLSSDMGISYQVATRVLDGEVRKDDARAVDKAWKEVMAAVRERGQGIVFVRATPAARGLLKRLADPRAHAGIRFVPLSTLVPRPPES
jgi:polysaccharide deacetylase 2 family uncharacterized protein YibQ